MPRKPEMSADTVLRLALPGNVRLQMAVYLPDGRQYHPVPKFSARVAADSPEQARELWGALVATIEEVVEGSTGKPSRVYPGWPSIGDDVSMTCGIERMVEVEDTPNGSD